MQNWRSCAKTCFRYITKNALSLLKHFCEHILDTLKRKQNRIFAPAHSIWQNFALREESEFVPFLIISRTRETTLFRRAPLFVRKHFCGKGECSPFYNMGAPNRASKGKIQLLAVLACNGFFLKIMNFSLPLAKKNCELKVWEPFKKGG